MTVTVCAVLALGACAVGEPPAPAGPSGSRTPSVTGAPPTSSGPATPVPGILRPTDDGGRFTMVLGTTSELLVSERSTGDPAVDGTSVLLVPVVNITDSGVREWEVRAVEPGTSTVRSTDPAYSFTITVS